MERIKYRPPSKALVKGIRRQNEIERDLTQMKIYWAILAGIVISVLLLSCRKDQMPPVPGPQEPADQSRVLLKEIIAQNLPSPYFRFAYNDSNFVSNIEFASGLFVYKVDYENGRIRKMTNFKNHTVLWYDYKQGLVSAIRSVHENSGTPANSWHLTYNTNRRLTEIKWYLYADKGSDSVLTRKTTLSYLPDGNLAGYEDYRKMDGQDLKWVRSVTFSEYDKTSNVDDFYLLKDFFDDVLYLPQVKLQINNPGKEKIRGEENDYSIEYTYQHKAKYPVLKISSMVQTRGKDMGTKVNFITRYSYYELPETKTRPDREETETKPVE